MMLALELYADGFVVTFLASCLTTHGLSGRTPRNRIFLEVHLRGDYRKRLRI